MEKGHRRSDAHHGFTHKGEDGEEGHGLGVEMQHKDLVMFEYRVEEGGERGNQACLKGINEDWDLGGRPSNASARRRPSHRLPPLVEAGGEHGTHLAHGLVVEHQGLADCRLDGWRRTWRGRRLLPLVCLFRRHDDEAGGVQVKLERRSRVLRKQRDWESKAWAMEE